VLDKAGKQYWSGVWGKCDRVNSMDPRDPGLHNYVPHRFHEYFHQLFSNTETRNLRLLEIGCARSSWLPYLGKEFGFKVFGIDYSDIGCDQSKQLLLREKVEGEIVCGDFFSPPESMVGAFDVVISFGVAEHFQDTCGCLRAFSRFLKPGGFLLTNIPNLTGLNGLIQRVVNRPVFDVHVPLDKEALADAHEVNRLNMISCDYFLFANLGVLNFENWKPGLFYSGACRIRTLINLFVWYCERTIPLLKPNRWSSPYINCLATKP